jgi:hypothetical protein
MDLAHEPPPLAAAALACAIVIVLGCLGGWYDGERRAPGGVWIEEVTHEESDGYDRDATTRILVLLLAVPALAGPPHAPALAGASGPWSASR